MYFLTYTRGLLLETRILNLVIPSNIFKKIKPYIIASCLFYLIQSVAVILLNNSKFPVKTEKYEKRN